MIVVDTSALLAILQEEEDGPRCAAAVKAAEDVCMSAATMTEALIVAQGRGLRAEMAILIEKLQVAIYIVTEEDAERTTDAYAIWGKGNHPAHLNFGDCFAYALAKELDCPLLFAGEDFARTDIKAA